MTLGRHAGGRLGRQSAPQARVEIRWRHEREAQSPVEGLVEGHVTERGQRDASGTRTEGVVQHGLHQPCPQAANLSLAANRDQMDMRVGAEALRTNEAEELVIRNGHRSSAGSGLGTIRGFVHGRVLLRRRGVGKGVVEMRGLEPLASAMRTQRSSS